MPAGIKPGQLKEKRSHESVEFGPLLDSTPLTASPLDLTPHLLPHIFTIDFFLDDHEQPLASALVFP